MGTGDGHQPGSGHISMLATGDSLITRPLRPFTEPEYLALVELVRGADVRHTNLEILFRNDEGYPSAESGGTWVAADPGLIEDLKWMGFNLFACANNHSMDWSWGGLRAHMSALARAGVVWAGVGKDAGQARMPAYLELGGGRVGLVSWTTTIPGSGRAGEARPGCQGRPGANTLRHFTIDAAGMGICYQPDAEKILAAVRDARRQADWVVCSMHSHEQLPGAPETPLQFQIDLAHAAVQAGADAVVCHGPHVIRGVEIYHGRPIFHGLGNFIFQNETLSSQPTDFYEQFGLGPEATVADLFDARNADRERSFTRDPAYWESIVARWSYQAGRLAEVKLYPVTLGYGRPRTARGRPVLARGDEAGRIIERLDRLSSPFGVRVRSADGIGVVESG